VRALLVPLFVLAAAACAEPRLSDRFAAPENQAVLDLAMAGNAEAQAALGEMFEEGRGGPPDYDAAARWYGKAADQGNALGAYRLGQLHEWGKGVARDYARAAELYAAAAQAGSAPAAYRLGYLLENGLGVRRDVDLAARWYARAGADWSANCAAPLAPTHLLAHTAPAAVPVAGSGPRVHLASLRTRDEAEAAWRDLLNRNPDVLGGLAPVFSELDLGEGVGTFVQVQAGSFATLEGARSACERLHARGQFCEPVAP
jgi:hypothetical protein